MKFPALRIVFYLTLFNYMHEVAAGHEPETNLAVINTSLSFANIDGFNKAKQLLFHFGERNKNSIQQLIDLGLLNDLVKAQNNHEMISNLVTHVLNDNTFVLTREYRQSPFSLQQDLKKFKEFAIANDLYTPMVEQLCRILYRIMKWSDHYKKDVPLSYIPDWD